jgi:hypothetical protein
MWSYKSIGEELFIYYIFKNIFIIIYNTLNKIFLISFQNENKN